MIRGPLQDAILLGRADVMDTAIRAALAELDGTLDTIAADPDFGRLLGMAERVRAILKGAQE